MSKKEHKFYNALKDVFVGAEIEGQSGYINLMKIKSRYFQDKVFPQLQEDIGVILNDYPNYQDELFDKLYDFFYRYFSESGSIYFRRTRYPQSVYEQVYSDDQDVILFWKTHMLYYVKTDRMFQSMDVELEEQTFFFDVSQLEHKKANEKRDLVYRYDCIRDDGAIVFTVKYSSSGSKTKMLDILRTLRRENLEIGEDILERAFRVFEKQSEVDYFINKDAEKFLKEQFDLWMYQYLFEGQNIWIQRRLEQLQALKELAYKIIDFIAQFEDELVRIWNKPKFVRKSHYVITLDRIAEKDMDVLKRVLASDGIADQLAEWYQLGMIKDDFELDQILANDEEGQRLDERYQYLPIDTRHFPKLEFEILRIFDNLDDSLDGWLINSENYQALRSLLPKFEQRIQAIYIDPPFNKEKEADYFYSVKYKDSTWITILENRLQLARDVLHDSGSIFIRCDYNGNMYVHLLMDSIFGKDNFINEILVNRGKQRLGGVNKYSVATDSLYFYSKSDEHVFDRFKRPRYSDEAKSTNMLMKGERHPPERVFRDPEGNLVTLLPPPDQHWKFIQPTIDEMYEKEIIYLAESRKGLDSGIRKIVDGKEIPVDYVPSYYFDEKKTVDANWTDISGYSADWDFETENSEALLKRVVVTGVIEENDIVMDFFLGSGTTTATAHKLGHKWIGIELSDYFYSKALPRMKKVVAYDNSGISSDDDIEDKYNKSKAGGFFKYYALEEYEDVLRKAKYASKEEPFDNIYEDTYEQYVFLRDEKMLHALEIDQEANEVHVDLSKLYDDIDLAETLANLRGKWIARIGPDFVEFEDGERIDLKNFDWELIKPLIWW